MIVSTVFNAWFNVLVRLTTGKNVVLLRLWQNSFFLLTGGQHKHESKSKATALASKKPVSVEAIRRSVRDSLKDILTQRSVVKMNHFVSISEQLFSPVLITTVMEIFHFRLKESDLHISVERASEVAKKTERELFHLFKDTDHKYKNKYRSLIFNLKDTKNNVSMTFLLLNYSFLFWKNGNLSFPLNLCRSSLKGFSKEKSLLLI